MQAAPIGRRVQRRSVEPTSTESDIMEMDRYRSHGLELALRRPRRTPRRADPPWPAAPRRAPAVAAAARPAGAGEHRDSGRGVPAARTGRTRRGARALRLLRA